MSSDYQDLTSINIISVNMLCACKGFRIFDQMIMIKTSN